MALSEKIKGSSIVFSTSMELQRRISELFLVASARISLARIKSFSLWQISYQVLTAVPSPLKKKNSSFHQMRRDYYITIQTSLKVQTFLSSIRFS